MITECHSQFSSPMPPSGFNWVSVHNKPRFDTIDKAHDTSVQLLPICNHDKSFCMK